MKMVKGNNPRVTKDETGGFISVDWVCPYCGEVNAGLYFTSQVDELTSHFAVTEKCECCGKTVEIECENPTDLF